jgi:hypothetical protein
MNNESRPYRRKEEVVVSDTMYEALTSPPVQEYYKTSDINVIVEKVLKNHLKKEFNIEVE